MAATSHPVEVSQVAEQNTDNLSSTSVDSYQYEKPKGRRRSTAARTPHVRQPETPEPSQTEAEKEEHKVVI